MCRLKLSFPGSAPFLPLPSGVLRLTSDDHIGHHLASYVLRDKLPDLLLTGEVQGKYLLKRRVKVHLDIAALDGVNAAHLGKGGGEGTGDSEGS